MHLSIKKNMKLKAPFISSYPPFLGSQTTGPLHEQLLYQSLIFYHSFVSILRIYKRKLEQLK